MNCRKTIRQLPAYLDNELTEDEAKALRKHLEVCLFCSTELAALRATTKMLDSWRSIEPRRRYVDAVMAQIRAEEGGVLARDGIWGRLLRSRWVARPVRVVAAVVFVAGVIVFSGRAPIKETTDKLALDKAEQFPSAKELISLDEDVRRSYISPSEYWLVLRGFENRGRMIPASSGNGPVGRTGDGRFIPVRGGFPEVDHIYSPEEGMPMESVIPVGSP
jgi:hypothetical protein